MGVPTDEAWGNTSQTVEMACVLFKRSPIVEISALLSRDGFVFSITYDWLVNCHLSDASCDCDEEADAEDHEERKRESGL